MTVKWAEESNERAGMDIDDIPNANLKLVNNGCEQYDGDVGDDRAFKVEQANMKALEVLVEENPEMVLFVSYDVKVKHCHARAGKKTRE